MADEQEAIAPPALETPASEPEVIETAPAEPERILAPGEAETAAASAAEPEAPEFIEVEWEDGNKYQIPKALEGGLLRNKDYTQKRQADAAKAKALESREA